MSLTADLEATARRLGRLAETAPEREDLRREAADLARRLLAAAVQEHERGRPEETLRLAALAKGLRAPTQALDLLRAVAFLGLGQPDSARQALLEELRYFPDNGQARELLERFERGAVASADDGEFAELDRKSVV